ncbi:C5a anaphylatoxin chemotactic receptor 1-like [Chanos chanos]|uniref:C5a anaphylatoxin chemotactic receptor 1-like n=1 Tax=Chanos chanos TaxID=29144 RepID=A0A6J2USJ2_CHACN|nr:C5a anaphylatoxin chemotactic receptor 1-like [Chanos chanos]
MSTSHHWDAERTVPAVIMGFCALVGIPANIAVVAAIGRRFKRESFTLTLMLSLAVCDLLSLLLVPLRMMNLLVGWSLGEFACKLLFFLSHWSLNSSVLTVTLLSIQRYLQILYPRRWAKLGPSGRWAMQGGVLALGCCIASPSISVRTVKNDPYQRCTVDYRRVLVEAFVLLGQTTLGFVVPFSTLACFYLCLHKRVRRSPFWNSPRMTKLVTGIVTSFFVFWVPLHFCNLLSLVCIAGGWHYVKKITCDNNWDYLIGFSYLYMCLNPFLYAFSHGQLQTRTAGSSRSTQPS